MPHDEPHAPAAPPAPQVDALAKKRRSQDLLPNKARKACINCRRQKMKCRMSHENSNICVRCLRSGVDCIFVPRANASSFVLSPSGATSGDNKDILRRLNIIEEYLGLKSPSDLCTDKAAAWVVEEDVAQDRDSEPAEDNAGVFNTLWEAAASLESICPSSAHPEIWHKPRVRHLWLSFHDKMPGLHFLPSKQRFSMPQPILLAAILYCSSARGEADVAALSPHYFSVLCHAIAQLVISGSDISTPPTDPAASEEWAFQTVLGLILAGLLNEAHVRETGVWISIAYRLILEHCPTHIDERSRDWRKLFTGIQIVDLEHASIHLSCPVIPLEPPLQHLRISRRDPLYRLSRMMHTGLTHFTGRGLPTIWYCFSATPPETIDSNMVFSPVDSAVLRDWARQLDEWFVEFSNDEQDTEQDRRLVFRQYVLHRLVVLSIYHPARGCNLYSNSITPKAQYELLLSARATLRLHQNDNTIWSNWDLIMITWAALIVVQAIEGGMPEPDDLSNIRIHIARLLQTNEPEPSLRGKLAKRLQQSIKDLQEPIPLPALPDTSSVVAISPEFDYSWQIFDQDSLQQFAYI